MYKGEEGVRSDDSQRDRELSSGRGDGMEADRQTQICEETTTREARAGRDQNKRGDAITIWMEYMGEERKRE
jgi:hypothetical protein